VKFHAAHAAFLPARRELVLVFGFALGCVEYHPQARSLYSFRLLLGIFRLEILWTTGKLISSPPPGTPQQANPLHRGVVARSTIDQAPRPTNPSPISNPPAPERSWISQSPLPVEGAPAP